MLKRPAYLEAIKPYIGIDLVKILSGVRRSGKSVILSLLADYLVGQGISDRHIVRRDYSEETLSPGFDAKAMHDDLVSSLQKDGPTYFFLDEVQEIEGWEKVLNALREHHDCDIYVTGSNSRLLSAEISTYLSGRYVNIPVYPLSFEEYLSFLPERDPSLEKDLLGYIRRGGFPLLAKSRLSLGEGDNIVRDIYSTVVMNDIIRRNAVDKPDLFNRVVRFVVENAGKTFSASSIVAFLKSENRSIGIETVYNYVNWLEKAFIVYRCHRYDLRGKEVLKTQEKLYLSDVSFRHALFGYSPDALPSLIENLVYLELRRRGYEVYVGKLYTREIDFVAVLGGERLYIQVCQELPKESTREVDNLLAIRDGGRKIIVSYHPFAGGSLSGIPVLSLSDFLLDKSLI